MSQVRPPDAFVAPRRTWSWLLLLPILLAVAGLTNAWAISPNAVNRITAPHTATTAVAAPMTVPANIPQLAMTRGSGPRAAPLQVGGMSSGLGLTAHIRVAAEGIPDATVIVRGGQGELPPPGEVFSGSLGSTLEDAAAGVRHGTVRSTTAGDIRAGGGTVEPNPELDPRVGQTNYQHVDVCLGSGPCPFGEPIPNPVPKSGRFGFPDYPYERWTE